MAWKYLVNNSATDSRFLLFNARNYSISLVGTNWLRADITSGTIPAGDSLGVVFSFSAQNPDPGDCRANIVVRSNDPVVPETLIRLLHTLI